MIILCATSTLVEDFIGLMWLLVKKGPTSRTNGIMRYQVIVYRDILTWRVCARVMSYCTCGRHPLGSSRVCAYG